MEGHPLKKRWALDSSGGDASSPSPASTPSAPIVNEAPGAPHFHASAVPKKEEPVSEDEGDSHSHASDDSEAEGDDGSLYCLCKTPYDHAQFYIACDKCDGWYHGKCVGITQAAAKKINNYICPLCRRENNTSEDSKDSKSLMASAASSKLAKTPDSKSTKAASSATKKPKGEGAGKGRKRASAEGEGKSSAAAGVNGASASKKTPSKPQAIVPEVPAAKRPKKEEPVVAAPAVAKKEEELDSIHCTCGHNVDEGLMLQCDDCKNWLHCKCCGFERQKDIPDSYTCPFCALMGFAKAEPTPMSPLNQVKKCARPGCVKPARPQSGYCSDSCGIQVATERAQLMQQSARASYFSQMPVPHPAAAAPVSNPSSYHPHQSHPPTHQAPHAYQQHPGQSMHQVQQSQSQPMPHHMSQLPPPASIPSMSSLSSAPPSSSAPSAMPSMHQMSSQQSIQQQQQQQQAMAMQQMYLREQQQRELQQQQQREQQQQQQMAAQVQTPPSLPAPQPSATANL